jgi:ribosomal protein S18 acetylase RimI-like enzyme
VKVEEAREVTPELVAAFERLIPQLSSSSPPPSADELQTLIDDSDIHVLVATEDDGRIVGTTTLVVFRIPTGVRALIEDVVVDSACAGRGISYDLARAALDVARSAGSKTVDLTSRPSRAAANHVYKKLGFEQRETNVWRFSLSQ